MTGQLPLPLQLVSDEETRAFLVGAPNEAAVAALQRPESWPYGVAILRGPARSGRSTLARWAATHGGIATVDDSDAVAEDQLFHRWNAAQETGEKLLLVAGEVPRRLFLPDLASRLGAALDLVIGSPDQELMGRLITLHAQRRLLALPPEAITYLVPRVERSYAALEQLVARIDALSLARKVAPGPGLWRAALLGEGAAPLGEVSG